MQPLTRHLLLAASLFAVCAFLFRGLAQVLALVFVVAFVIAAGAITLMARRSRPSGETANATDDARPETPGPR